MTSDEAKGFLNACAFVAFPGVRNWLAKTKTPIETWELWSRIVSELTADEAEAVIDRWIKGGQSFESYERFATEIRIKGLSIREDRLRAERYKDLPRHKTEHQVFDGSIMRSVERSDVWPRWLSLRAGVLNGDITIESALSEWKAILDERFRKEPVTDYRSLGVKD